jgi:hypothetical protein
MVREMTLKLNSNALPLPFLILILLSRYRVIVLEEGW